MATRAHSTPTKAGRRRPALNARTRARLEDLVERLITTLDALDGDPDMEPDVDGEVTPNDEGEALDYAPNVIRLPRLLRTVQVTA